MKKVFTSLWHFQTYELRCATGGCLWWKNNRWHWKPVAVACANYPDSRM